MKIFNKRELQQIASNHMKLYQDYTKEPFSFLLNNTTFYQIIHCHLERRITKMAQNQNN